MGAASELPPPVLSRPDEGRKLGRIRLRLVTSNIGDVGNISATGAQIFCRGLRAPSTKGTLLLEIDGTNCLIKLEARVVWVKRIGLFSHVIGVEFCNPDAAAKKGLVELVRRVPMNDIYARCEDLRRSA